MFFVLGWLGLVNGELVAAQSDSGRAAATNPIATANSRLQQTTVPADSEEYRIRAGDLLNISVFQEPELSQMVKVPQSGSIRHSLLGVIQVKGLTTSEAEKKITELLAKDYLVNPRVSITVETNKSRRVVTVLGEVKQPGAIEIPDQEQVTLLQLIGRVGGFTNIAATDRVTIIRTENGKEQVIRVNVPAIIKSGDKSKDIELKPGDVVSVPESFF
ncbi:MAG: polysaccharide biosynthesis/export family protein [Verrucomicrobiia bacterium]|jgi:polysaccharide export outer membrane protein